jgi:hypothetical protein
MSDVLKITSIQDIQAKAAPIVALPGWDAEPFYAQLKRVSVFNLASKGKIPNALYTTAISLFEGKGGKKNEEDTTNLEEISKVMDILIEEAMVQPTYSEVKEYLTDEQKYAIFNFTQGGINALKSFRPEQGNTGDN